MKPIDLARLVLLAALWGGSYLFVRVAAPVLGVFPTISLRVVLAAFTLIVYSLVTRQSLRLKKGWRSYFLLGLLNNAIPFVLIAVAIVNLNASIAATLNATTPLFTAIVAAVWLKEDLTRRKIAGLLLGVMGVAVLVGWSPLPLSAAVIQGGLFALIAALAYGIAAVYARRQFATNRSIDTTMGQLLASSLLLLPGGVISMPIQMPSIGVILAVLTLAIACTTFAYLLYFQLISSAGATRTATVTFLIPVFSLLFGKVWLNEPVTSGLVIGLLTILFSVWLVIGARGPGQAVARS